MSGWATPGQDTMRRIAFQLQRPGWRITSPASSDSDDGRWHATDGTSHLAAPSLEALLDELDWRTPPDTPPAQDPGGRPPAAGTTGIAGERCFTPGPHQLSGKTLK